VNEPPVPEGTKQGPKEITSTCHKKPRPLNTLEKAKEVTGRNLREEEKNDACGEDEGNDEPLDRVIRNAPGWHKSHHTFENREKQGGTLLPVTPGSISKTMMGEWICQNQTDLPAVGRPAFESFRIAMV